MRRLSKGAPLEKTVDVELTVQELMILRVVMGKSNTSDIKESLERLFGKSSVDGLGNGTGVDYKLHLAIKGILEEEGYE